MSASVFDILINPGRFYYNLSYFISTVFCKHSGAHADSVVTCLYQCLTHSCIHCCYSTVTWDGVCML